MHTSCQERKEGPVSLKGKGHGFNRNFITSREFFKIELMQYDLAFQVSSIIAIQKTYLLTALRSPATEYIIQSFVHIQPQKTPSSFQIHYRKNKSFWPPLFSPVPTLHFRPNNLRLPSSAASARSNMTFSSRALRSLCACSCSGVMVAVPAAFFRLSCSADHSCV